MDTLTVCFGIIYDVKVIECYNILLAKALVFCIVNVNYNRVEYPTFKFCI